MPTAAFFRVTLVRILGAYAAIYRFDARMALPSGGAFFRSRTDVRQIGWPVLVVVSIVSSVIAVVAPVCLTRTALLPAAGWS